MCSICCSNGQEKCPTPGLHLFIAPSQKLAVTRGSVVVASTQLELAVALVVEDSKACWKDLSISKERWKL